MANALYGKAKEAPRDPACTFIEDYDGNVHHVHVDFVSLEICLG